MACILTARAWGLVSWRGQLAIQVSKRPLTWRYEMKKYNWPRGVTAG